MLRKDGDITFYQIVSKNTDGEYKDGKWFTRSLDHFQSKVPFKVKYKSHRHAQRGEIREPFAAFTASGKCWQETGYHGSYKRKLADKLASILAEFNPDNVFAVREVNLKQTTRIVSQARA